MNTYLETKQPEKCSGCGACTSICPVSCIEMSVDKDGFLFPYIKNADECINCGLCSRVCPIEHPFMFKGELNAYGSYSTDENVLLKCSSGGLFPELAKHFVKEGGCVYGAAFDDNWCLRHEKAEQPSELIRLYGSKYVQSEIGNSYEDCKFELNQGRLVLFTGTPCQISGLHNYLKKDYENLYTIDVICHGVPSNKIFHAYLDSLEKKHNGRICEVVFRDKSKNGWSITLKYAIKKKNGKISSYYYKSSDSSYFTAFLKGMIARESCYNCPFATLSRPGDLSLGDFWGYQKTRPELENLMGLSLVLCNSLKGNDLINILKSRNVFFSEVNENSIRNSENKNLYRPTTRNENRNVIYEELENNGYSYIEKHFIPTRSRRKMIEENIRHFLSQVKHKYVK